MSDLTTLTDVEAWLGLKPGNADEPLLSRLITAASALVEQWCGRVFALQSYTETWDGAGERARVFSNTPVTAVASLTINGVAVPAEGPGVRGRRYVASPTRLALKDGWLSPGIANIVVSYTAGYATPPLDVAQATIELVAMRYRERDRIGLASKAVGGETTAFNLKDMPADVAALVATWRKVVPL